VTQPRVLDVPAVERDLGGQDALDVVPQRVDFAQDSALVGEREL
jgi:hypothetical protein